MTSWISPTGRPIRGTDEWGSGEFGASRAGRPHYGIDYVCVPGQDVVSPCDATVLRYARPYTDTTEFRGIHLVTQFCRVTIFYVIPLVTPKQTIMRGDIIGTAQDISRRYSVTMTPHVHVEVRLIPGIPFPQNFRLWRDFLMRPSHGIYINPERAWNKMINENVFAGYDQ